MDFIEVRLANEFLKLFDICIKMECATLVFNRKRPILVVGEGATMMTDEEESCTTTTMKIRMPSMEPSTVIVLQVPVEPIALASHQLSSELECRLGESSLCTN